MPAPDAIIDLRDGRYFAAIAFVYGEQHRDYLASVWRDKDGPWTMTCRFRYYIDDRAHDSADEKCEMCAVDTHDRTEEEMLRTLRITVEALVAGGFNDRLDWLDVKSDDAMVVFEKLAARPWAHVQRMPAQGDA
jgi:hypothetical protein